MRTLRTARIVHVVRDLLWTFGGQLIEPINQLRITSAFLDETVEPIAAIASALLTKDAQDIELADEIAENDGTVAGAWLACLP